MTPDGRLPDAPHERGSGVLGTSFGILFFLGFLLLATQVAVSLYARTVVHGAALDAGRLISLAAGSDGELQPGELATAERAAHQRVAELLGHDASLTVEAVDPVANRVTVSVEAPRPRLLFGGGTLGDPVLRETVELRLETLQ